MTAVTTTTCYLFAGPDRHRKRRRVDAIAASLSVHALDWLTLDAAEAPEAVLTAAREHAAGGGRRLIVVEHAERLDAEAVAWLGEHLDQVAQTATVVLLTDAELGAKHPLTPLSKGRATVERFAWLDDEAAGRWVQDRVTEAGKRIAPAAVQRLLDVCGGDLSALERLVEQLTAWLGGREQISRADADEFLTGRPPTAAASAGRERDRGPFILVELIGRRHTAAALAAAAEQLDSGRDVLEVLGLIVWQLQRWVTIAHLAGEGVPKARWESLSGIKAWQLDRIQTELSGRPLAWLSSMVDACRRLDAEIKTGRVIPRVGLELLIVQLCAPPRPLAGRRGGPV
jgi:DNA polymerase-3 subunit delta